MDLKAFCPMANGWGGRSGCSSMYAGILSVPGTLAKLRKGLTETIMGPIFVYILIKMNWEIST